MLNVYVNTSQGFPELVQELVAAAYLLSEINGNLRDDTVNSSISEVSTS